MGANSFLCIGHRGAMGHAPENTLSSVQKALDMGVLFVEADVYEVENNLVVIHDDRLERTTNGHGYVIEQSFSFLRTLDAGDGQQIPTLSEICELIDGKAGINIELKGPNTAGLVSSLICELLEKGWDSDSFLVSSFDHRELMHFQKLSPSIKIGALICGLMVDDAKFAADLGAYSVHQSLEFVDQKFVDDAHGRGLKVFVYTVNHPEDVTRMRQLGVDGVFTNFPERVLDPSVVNSNLTIW